MAYQLMKRKFEDTDDEGHLNTKKRISHSSKYEYNSILSVKNNIPSPPQEKEDKMVIDEEITTDEDEMELSPPASINQNSYIRAIMEPDLDEGGYIGQLERGWSDMYYDMY